MEKKQSIRYTVEREFLSEFSAEELIIRIIKTHLNEKQDRYGSEMGESYEKCI